MSVFLPIIAAAFFGLGYAFSEKALQTMNVATYMLVGSVFGLLIAVGLSYFRSEPFSLTFANDKITFLQGVVAVLAPALGWVFTVYAIQHISASYAAFAELSYPLFALLFLFLFFGVRHFDWWLLAGGALVMAGSFLLVYGQTKLGGA